MSITDPLADMFTIMRNASRAKKEKADLPSSRAKLAILNVFKKEGYIKNYKYISDEKQGMIRIYLKFKRDKGPVITNIKRVSKSGIRIYAAKDKIPRVLRGMGIAIISTSLGIMTGKEARRLGVGGEVICYVW